VFVRPTAETQRLLTAEMSQPRFQEYHIFFSNIVPAALLRAVAEADDSDFVKQVRSLRGFYRSVSRNHNLFSTLCPRSAEDRLFDALCVVCVCGRCRGITINYIAINADLFTLNVERPLILATNRYVSSRYGCTAFVCSIKPLGVHY
jgi:hypothetical protein